MRRLATQTFEALYPGLKDSLARESLRSMLELSKKSGDRALDVYPKIFWDKWNIRPEINIGDEDKKRLLKEKGVIISNHPGILDVPLILEALKDESGKVRRNVKIFINSENYPIFSEYLGKEYFLEAKRDYPDAKAQLDIAIDFVRDGGIFLIFPSGGNEQLNNDPLEFRSGFSYLVDKLDSDTMIFGFKINTDDFRRLSFKGGGMLPRSVVAGMHMVKGTPNINMFRGKKRIRMEGKYSKAFEWKEVVRGKNLMVDKNQSHTQHYQEKFKI